jgi:hypothetical protein
VVVGDVVCARHPTNPAETVIKRIIGMPGDFVGSGEVDGGGNLIQVRFHCHNWCQCIEKLLTWQIDTRRSLLSFRRQPKLL